MSFLKKFTFQWITFIYGRVIIVFVFMENFMRYNNFIGTITLSIPFQQCANLPVEVLFSIFIKIKILYFIYRQT